MSRSFTIVGFVSLPPNNNTVLYREKCSAFPGLDTAIMAAVYSEKEGSLQSNNESSSIEYEKDAVQEVSIDPVRNIKTFNAENTIEEKELGLSGPILKAQDHAEVVASNAAFPAVKIKIEEVDEDECVSVYLDQAKEKGLDGRTTKKEDLSERDKTADGKQLFCC